jgi:hypothetical protein
MKFRKKIYVEDEGFKNSTELYERLSNILSDACLYDVDKHDTIATIEEIEKYLNVIKKELMEV